MTEPEWIIEEMHARLDWATESTASMCELYNGDQYPIILWLDSAEWQAEAMHDSVPPVASRIAGSYCDYCGPYYW